MTRFIEGLFNRKPAEKIRVKEPVEGFDVKKIAEILDGWELTQPDPERYEGFYQLERTTTDGKRLCLSLYPNEDRVHFAETRNGNTEYDINFPNVIRVELIGGVRFEGEELDYWIFPSGDLHSLEGRHDTISQRDYNFGP